MPPFIGRAIAYSTYIKYCNMYGIPVKHNDTTDRKMKELAKDIHAYEMKHILPKPGKYGLYVEKSKNKK